MEYHHDFRNDQIFSEHLPQVESLNLQGLDTRYKSLLYLSALSNLMLPLGWVVAAFVFDFWEVPLLGFGVLFAVILLPLASLSLVNWSFRIKGYAIRQYDVVYQSGLLFRTLTVVPFNRVQHCEIHRGVFSRILGLSQVNVYTAGGSGSDLSIPGLSEADAERICAFILKQVNTQADEEE